MMENRNREPLRVGGEKMLQLLRGIDIKTLEKISKELRSVTFGNVDLIKVVDRVLDSRVKKHLEEGDTISMEPSRVLQLD